MAMKRVKEGGRRIHEQFDGVWVSGSMGRKESRGVRYDIRPVGVSVSKEINTDLC